MTRELERTAGTRKVLRKAPQKAPRKIHPMKEHHRTKDSAEVLDFDSLDRNGDGILDLDELRPVAHLIDVERADINGDGVLNRAEFNAARGALIREERRRRQREDKSRGERGALER